MNEYDVVGYICGILTLIVAPLAFGIIAGGGIGIAFIICGIIGLITVIAVGIKKSGGNQKWD